MPDIKEKPKGGKPKARSQTALQPQQAGRLLKEKYLHQLDQRRQTEDSESEYATDQVEGGGRWAVDELADAATHRPVKERRETVKHKAHAKEPGREDVPPADTGPVRERPANAPKERKEVEPSPANTPKERLATTKVRSAEAHAPKTADITPGQTPRSSPATVHSAKPQHLPAHTPLNNRRRGSAALHPPTAGTPPQSAQPLSHIAPTHPAETSAGCVSMPGRSSMRVKERPVASRNAIKTRANIRAAKAHSKGIAPKQRPTTPQAIVKQTSRKTRQATQQHMTHRMVVRAQKASRSVALATKRMAVAAAKAATALVGSLVGLLGGGFLLIALVIVVVIAAVANSPFGLFFAAEKNAPDTVSVAEAVATVNVAYNAKLEELQAGDYDSIVIHGQAPDWPEVLAVFAVKLAGADADGLDVATLDAARVEKLTAVFWDMTAVATEVEAIYHPGDPGWTEYILHITITPKTADDMRTAYQFTPYQNSALDELLSDKAALSQLAGSLTITSPDLADILKNLPTDLSPERREAVRTALTLVGKVNYFWGGKSSAIGWDSRWGTLQKVWAEGNSTTGTYRPYGLDCTGFIDWVYRNAGVHSDGHWYVGTNLTELSWEDALPGDIALFPDASHVGIVVGRSADGGILVCHCSYSQNNVVVTDCAATGFTSIGRPDVFG